MNNQQMMELTTVEKSEFEQLVSECTRSGSIDSNLYIEYDVKRGLGFIEQVYCLSLEHASI